MNAFAMFAAQHAELLANRNKPAPRGDARVGARPDTATEKAVLEYVKSNPDANAQLIASAVQVDPEQLYPIMQRLKRNGQIFSTGKIGNGNRWRAVQCL